MLMLQDGRWPPEHRETGYYDTGGRKLRRGGAYYEVPVCIAADVDARVSKCGSDGTLTKQCITEGWDTETLAEIMHKPLDVIEAKIRRVVHYCSGPRARHVTYQEFKRRRGIKASHGK